MISSKLTLLFFLLAMTILPASAFGATSAIKKSDCNVLLQPNTHLYGTWKCEPCDELNTMRPNDQGQVRCQSCQKYHIDQLFGPPVTREQGDQVFVRAVDIISRKDRFDLSYRIQCPTCKASNFGYTAEAVGNELENCAECNGPLKGANKLVEIAGEKHLISLDQHVAGELNAVLVNRNQTLKILNDLRKQFLDMRGSGVGITVEEVDRAILTTFEDFAKRHAPKLSEKEFLALVEKGGEEDSAPASAPSPARRARASNRAAPETPVASAAHAETPIAGTVPSAVIDQAGQPRRNQAVMNWLGQHRRTLLAVAGATSVALMAGAIHHGYQPVVYQGEVRSITDQTIGLRYSDGKQSWGIELRRDENLRVLVGDQIWIHTRRWIGQSIAVEFESGDVRSNN